MTKQGAWNWFCKQYKKQCHCRFGRHSGTHSANFCYVCGYQLNQNAFANYEVTLITGEFFLVEAVNESAARFAVCYESKVSIDKKTGEQAFGEPVIHPDNIKQVVKL